MKKHMIGTAGLTLALLLAGCGGEAGNETAGTNAAGTASTAPLPQVEAPNGDWTQVVAETPEGGFRMGNPNAPVKLVEYASLSCPACAAFSATASEPLKNQYVKSGQVSWEFRPYLLFPTDAGVSLLLRCQGPGPFFRMTEQLYADQQGWLGRVQQLPPAELQAIQALPPREQVGALVRATGLDTFFRQRGMPQARIDACLADDQGLQKLVSITERGANQDEVRGTPTFLINGETIQGLDSWPKVEAELREAIG